MEQKFGNFVADGNVRYGAQRTLSAVLENWLDRERDQLPLWFPVGIGFGVAFWQFFGSSAWAGLAMSSASLLFFGNLAPPYSRLRQLARMAAMAIMLGFLLIALRSTTVAQPVLGKIWVGEFYGRIEAVENISARNVFRLRLATGSNSDLPPFVRVNLSPEQYQDDFQPGAIIRLRARLLPPAGPTLPGGYDFARRAWFLQIGATGTALGEVQLHQKADRGAWFATQRAALTQHIMASMPQGSGAIGAALVTGDQGHIDAADAQAMRDSGLAHLLSISGLHVTAVVGFIFIAVSRLLSLSPWLALRIPIPVVAAATAALAALAYTLLTGAEVPTVRSFIAAVLILIALAIGRDALTLRLVAFGALIVLIFWPDARSGPSFQLSFAAVATIVVMHDLPVVKRFTERRDESLLRKAARAVGSLILTGLAIELVLTPIALFHFHKAGLYGALANVVAIPMTTFMIMPLEALALIFDVLGLGQPLWWLAGQGIAAILILAHSVSSLPGAVTMMPAMPIWAFAAFVIGALLFALLTTAVRYCGVLLCAIGIIAMVMAPRPDILVTGDGKHLAIVSADGEVALLRGRAGDFVRGMIFEKAGSFAKATPIEDWPGVQCTLDNCVITLMGAERAWTLLATRTRNPIPSMEMAAACKRVDIVVSDRWLPQSCRPKWIKADRRLLEQSGGLAFYLDDQRVVTANEGNRNMPWVKAAQAARAAEASDQ
ncbi:ComEC/Rec2 family competence protein [Sphingorhabdus sp. EL138]|uniref:ComEC/Rec2 family competence protein n=1 Tax=Sphingorhabdus sp. EL138 TaxID=2073156 RepID=UPI0025ED3036|nr:ComEC/Rec2 family competence protein [Sphingorhabdus sp. EL138]